MSHNSWRESVFSRSFSAPLHLNIFAKLLTKSDILVFPLLFLLSWPKRISIPVQHDYILVCGFVSLTHLKSYTKFVEAPKEIKSPNLVPHSLWSFWLSLPDNGNSFSEESIALWAWLEKYRVGLLSSQQSPAFITHEPSSDKLDSGVDCLS